MKTQSEKPKTQDDPENLKNQTKKQTSETQTPSSLKESSLTKEKQNLSSLFTIYFLPVPLLLITFVIAWTSWNSGRKAVNELTNKLEAKIEKQVVQELDSYLETPHNLNQVNIEALESGIINRKNYEGIGHLFWQQMQVFNIGYISYSTDEGRFIGVGKMPNGEFSIDSLPSPKEGKVYFYNVDEKGNRSEQPRRIKENYQPLEDAWYAKAAARKETIWSGVYVWQPWYKVNSDQSSETLSISASSPILDENGRVRGVIGTELPLNNISDFLSEINISQAGEMFIMERDGKLVATSSERSILNEEGERLLAEQIQEPLIQETAQYLESKFTDFGAIDQSQKLTFSIEGSRQFVQIIPWQDQYGLDWLIVTTVPESTLMGSIQANRNQTLFLILIALGLAGGLSAIVVRWLSRPIQRLSQVAEEVASGNLNARAKQEGVIETQALASNFNNLVERAQQLLQEQEATTIEQRQQREELEREVSNLINDIENASEGDLTVRAQLMEGDIGIIADLFNAVVENLQDTAKQVKEAASRVSSSLGDNEAEIRLLAEGAIEEAEEIQTTLDSVEKMNRSIQEVAQNAQKAASIADTAFVTAQEGNQAMEQTVETIQGLRATVGDTAEKVQQMGASAQKISKVVSIIDQISLKTTLLAMNASVEANRAGELGQGFTAVAQQVEALSEQSASAAKEIAQIVSSIQNETQEAIESMQKGNKEVIESTRSVEATKARLAEVVTRSEEINNLMQSISDSTVSQAETSQAVSRLMEQVAQSSQDRSQTSKEVAQAIQETAKVAQSLEGSVEQFKVDK